MHGRGGRMGKALTQPNARTERDRNLFEMADFGEVLTPGVAELHKRTRERRPTAEAIAPGYDYCSETVQWRERKQWQLGHFAEGTPVPTNPRRRSFSISTMCSLWSAKAT